MGDKRKMTEKELRQKCKERAKIFQQAMEGCHSSSPMDCIEWFADRIADLEKENAELKARLKEHESIGNAQFWENVWSWKTKAEQLTNAKELLKRCCDNYIYLQPLRGDIEQFLSEVEK
jgi:hypothetical protein